MYSPVLGQERAIDEGRALHRPQRPVAEHETGNFHPMLQKKGTAPFDVRY